jgi:predicted amidohydrolase YtcJ
LNGSDSALRQAYVDRAQEAVKLGVTSIQNMATSLDAAGTGRAIAGLSLPIRVRVIRFPGSTPTGAGVSDWRQLKTAPGSPIVVSGTKWILDGTPIERLAALRAPYSDRPGWRGRLDFPPDTVRALLAEILAAKDQPLLHAVGDSAIALAFTTMTALAPDSVWRALRPRIEHGEGLAPDLFAAARQLGVIVVQNPTHLALGSVAPTRYGPERLVVLQPLKSLLANHIPLALGSDGPLDPGLNLMFAVTHPDHPAEAITMEQAVRAYTAGSAYAEFEERNKGRLVPGMLADLAVLSQDIFTVPPASLPGTTSKLTLVGGKPVWDPGHLLP